MPDEKPTENLSQSAQDADFAEAFGSFIDKGFIPETEEDEGEASRPADDDVDQDRTDDTLSDDVESAEDDLSDEDEDQDEDEADEDGAEDDEEDDAEDVSEALDAADDALVEIDGEKIPVAELRDGYLRQQDYTAKTNEVAQQRQQVEARVTEIQESQKQLGAINATMLGFLQQILPEEPSMDLYRTDPVAYQDQKIYRDHILGQMQGVKGLIDKTVQEEQGRIEQQYTETVQQGAQALVKARPFLKDPAKRKTYFDNLASGAKEHYDIDPEIVLAATDPQVILVLEDALRYRKAKTKAPETKRRIRKRPVMKSGSRDRKKTPVAVDRAKREIGRAEKTGRVQDASDALGALLTAGD